MNMNVSLGMKAPMGSMNSYLFTKQMNKPARKGTIFAKEDDDNDSPSIGTDTTRIIRPKKPTIMPNPDEKLKVSKNVKLDKTIKIDKKQ